MSGYNGWTNYETWVVKLWLDNEESTYRDVIELAERIKADWDADELANATANLADAIEHYVDDIREIQNEGDRGGAWGLFEDLLTAALDAVNWEEIAKAYMDEVQS